MNVATITMDPNDAREQLREYRSALHRRADAEYEAIVKGLQALADGTQILRLTDSIVAGGFHPDTNLPRLAIARADRERVRASWGAWPHPASTVSFISRDNRLRRGRAGTGLQIDVALGDCAPEGALRRGEALVPMIPAKVRNNVRFDARRCFILWEVERWELVAPRDPYLLRHLAGDAYAVLDSWDLTELERMVMQGRAH